VKRIWQSLLLLIVLATPAYGALQEIIVVTEGSGASETARSRAVLSAKQQAIARVAYTLNPTRAPEYLGSLTPATMQPLIRGISVIEEKRVDMMYYARMKVSVIDTPIREAFGEIIKEEKHAEDPNAERRSILVLPVFFDGKDAVVWDEKTNLTYGMWREASYQVGHGVLMVPSGDPKERAVVDMDNVLTASYDYLKPLLTSYGTDEIAIVVLNEPAAALPEDPVEMVIRRVRDTGQRIERFSLAPTQIKSGLYEPRRALYARAVKQAAELLKKASESTAYLEQRAKREAKQQVIKVEFTTLKQWAQIETKLRAVDGFVALDTLLVGIYQAEVILYVKDEPSTLRESLMKAGLIVADVDGLWRIRMR
jgi:hypothetical protein